MSPGGFTVVVVAIVGTLVVAGFALAVRAVVMVAPRQVRLPRPLRRPAAHRAPVQLGRRYAPT